MALRLSARISSPFPWSRLTKQWSRRGDTYTLLFCLSSPRGSSSSLAVIGWAAYNRHVSSQFDDLAKRIRALPAGEKAALVRQLIDDLDPGQDPDVEKLWLDEAERRYAQYLRGEVEAIPGDEVMAEARKRLK